MKLKQFTCCLTFLLVCFTSFAVGNPAKALSNYALNHGRVASQNAVENEEWPTYMGNAARTGITTNKIKLPLHLNWQFKTKHAPSPAWPAPAVNDYFNRHYNLKARVVYDRAYQLISADHKIFFGSSSDDSVTCLDAFTGKLLWKFYTEGPVRLAPSYSKGKLYFGSDDGHLYCIDAKTGKKVWRTRPSPKDQKIGGNQRVISLCPVRSGILTIGDEGYYCAGLFPKQGVYYGKLDLKTGKIKNQRKVNIAAQGYLKQSAGKIFTPTGRVAKGAWLDKLSRRGLINEKHKAQVNNTFPYAAIGNDQYFFRGGKDIIGAFDSKTGVKKWEAKIEGKAYSLAIAAGMLYVSTDKGQLYCYSAKQVTAKHLEESTTVQVPTIEPHDKALAKKVLEMAKIDSGYCLLMGTDSHATFARSLAEISNYQIIVREASAHKATEARKIIAAAGLEKRITIHVGNCKKMPYSSNFFNLIINGKIANHNVSPTFFQNELKRIVRPAGGLIFVGKTLKKPYRRPALKGAGEWTHFYGDAGNTACSNDKLISDKLALQWFGRPGPRKMVDRHNRTVAPLYKNGRMFLSGQNWFAGVDAYNGTVLWEKDVPNSMRMSAFKGSGNMVAWKDYLLVAAGNKCIQIDGQTGEDKKTFTTPGAGEWCYTAIVDHQLFGSETEKETLRWTLSSTSWKIGYSPNTAFICSRNLFAYDLNNPTKKREYTPGKGVIVTPTISISNGTVFFVENNGAGALTTYKKNKGRLKLGKDNTNDTFLMDKNLYLVALDAKTFKVKWKKPVGNLGFQHSLFMISKGKNILLFGSRVDHKTISYVVHCFNTKTGKDNWQTSFKPKEQDLTGYHGELVQHGTVIDNTFFISNASINMKNGKVSKNWQWIRGAHGCGTLSSSADYMFWRGVNPRFAKVGKTFKGDTITSVNRPGCWISVVPAGGLLLMPEASSGCTCNYPIQTSLVYRAE